MARVGHLFLRGYGGGNFEENWSEREPIQIQIPVGNLTQKLRHKEQTSGTGQYPLKAPAVSPLQLADVKVHDIEPDPLAQSDLDDDDLLNLTILLQRDAGPPTATEDGKVNDDAVSGWWKTAQKEREKASDKERTEGWFKVQEQIYLIDVFGQGTLRRIVQALAREDGGYILIGSASLILLCSNI
ncbi:hypothetical protein KFU94_63850, partial [Chloroflexi bacterium TSY]|nr:hypothetical protein [Chloroflexi bacterium TSY]